MARRMWSAATNGLPLLKGLAAAAAAAAAAGPLLGDEDAAAAAAAAAAADMAAAARLGCPKENRASSGGRC